MPICGVARQKRDESRQPLPPRLADSRDGLAEADLEGDDLSWEGLDVIDLELPATLDDLQVEGCVLRDVRFTGCQIERFSATDTVLEDCELSGALLDGGRLHRVEFRRCRMSGVILTGLAATEVRWVACRANDANLRAAKLDHVELTDCDLVGADFYAATLTSSRLLGCDLTGAEFSKAKLNAVALHRSTLHDLRGAAGLSGAVIHSHQMIPLAAAALSALGIKIDDDYLDPPDRR